MAKVLGKPSADDVKRVAVAALVAALDDSKETARKKPALTGMRAVATGAVLYTAGRAVISGRRFVNDRLNGSDSEVDEEEESDDEDSDEPVSEEDEDFDEEEEPEAEEDEDFDEEEEPEAEEDEDFDDEDEDDVEERSAARKPPRRHDPEDEDLPERPSRRREPVGRR